MNNRFLRWKSHSSQDVQSDPTEFTVREYPLRFKIPDPYKVTSASGSIAWATDWLSSMFHQPLLWPSDGMD